ncbi:MAG: hypothetical protein JW839_15065 [Candidatus Lokiarchaeota archaeon]|nr:hypothetical protein [Candidatus Lokiarchaeota archaeon]
MSINEELTAPLGLECESDEVLLVQATGHDGWFLDTLDTFNVAWEAIPGAPRWIQFDIPSFKLRWLMRNYSDVTMEVLE